MLISVPYQRVIVVIGVLLASAVLSQILWILRSLDVEPRDASQNTWSWSVRRAEKKAADWTAYCGVITLLLLLMLTAA